MKPIRMLLVLLLALAATEAATAQRSPETHNGFWLSGGLGGGWLDGSRGGAFYLRLGGTPTGKALFGGEVISWFRSDDVFDYQTRVNTTATVYFYPLYPRPKPGSEFFVKAGFGVATANDDLFENRNGVGTTFGTGYDFRLGNNFFVTLNVDLLLQFFDNDTDTGVLFTLGFGLH